MKKRLFGILLSFALMLTMMPVLGLSQTAYADDVTNYDLWIDGNQVTSANMDNVLGDDTVSFTPAEDGNPAKLTLKGAKITKTYYNKGIYYNGTDDLIIELASGTENSVICNESFCDAIVFTNRNITITGKGGLTAIGNSNGINAEVDSLTIDGSDVTVNSNGYGIQTNNLTIKSGTLNVSGDGNPGVGIYCKGRMNIIDGNITAMGSSRAINTNTADNVTLGKGVTVKAGDNEESAADVTNTFVNDHNEYKWVQTKEVPKYPLWIGETQVTSVNYSGENWYYDINTNTLRLNGSGFGSGEYSEDSISYDYGIRCELPDLTINVLTDSTVEGSGTGTYSYGIFAPGCDLTITGNGKLSAKGGSGDTGSGSDGFTAGIKAQTLNINGKLEAAGGLSSQGISHSHGIEAKKINVTGELTATGEGCGIYGCTDGVMIAKGSKATIIGGENCTHLSTVKNDILGTGWTDTDGTEGATLIKAGSTGHDLSKFKKAVFPTEADPATVTTKPTGKTLTYNGKAQELVTVGKAEGGEMQYAIGKDNKTAPTTGWSKSIPNETDAGTYYVWYKVVGDENHEDTEPAYVTAKIEARQFTITYNLNGGKLDGETGKVTRTAKEGEVITLPAPTRDGYTFDYWEGSKYYAGDKYKVNGDHTFKAVWKTAAGENGSKGGSSKKGVNTGDENTLGAWIVLLMAALAGTTGMVFARKRRND